ncbi:MAG: flagellar hook-basal body protein, partial [Bacillota bacterium]
PRGGPSGRAPRPGGGPAVVDPAGRPLLLADGRPLVLPQGAREAKVSPEGQVTVTLANGQQVAVGTIALAWPATGDALEARGDGLFAYTGAPGGLMLVVPGTAGAGTIRQGMLEQANVSPPDEMVRLLAAQRAYELNARAIRTADEMMGLVNNLRA